MSLLATPIEKSDEKIYKCGHCGLTWWEESHSAVHVQLCNTVQCIAEKTQVKKIPNIITKTYITEAEEKDAEIPEEEIDIKLLEEETIKEEIEEEVPVEKRDLNVEGNAELTLNAEENAFLNEEKMDNFFIRQRMHKKYGRDKKWELVGITETTQSISQFSKNKNRFIYHIKNRISNRYHQYCLDKVNMDSINLTCHTGKCKAMLSMEIGNF